MKPYSFDLPGLMAEAAQIRMGLQQLRDPLIIPTVNAGLVQSSPFALGSGWLDFGVPVNGVMMERNIGVGSPTPAIQSSNIVAVVYAQMNREDAPWIAFDFVPNSQNHYAFTGTIYRIRFFVQTVGGAGSQMVFVPMTACGVTSTGASGGGSQQSGTLPASGGGGA